MLRTEILKKYIDKSGRSWQDLAHDIGRLPETVEDFEKMFIGLADPNGVELKADTLETLAVALDMPASVAGYVFFADPDQDPNYSGPECIIGAAEPDNYQDALIQIFEDLDVRARHKLLQLAYELHDKAEAVSV